MHGWYCDVLQEAPRAQEMEYIQNLTVALASAKPLDYIAFFLIGRQVGHAGTLDPMATGLLIVCVGKGTKSVDSFMALEKEYTGLLQLGEATPSYDTETEVCQRKPWEQITGAWVITVATQPSSGFFEPNLTTLLGGTGQSIICSHLALA